MVYSMLMPEPVMKKGRASVVPVKVKATLVPSSVIVRESGVNATFLLAVLLVP